MLQTLLVEELQLYFPYEAVFLVPPADDPEECYGDQRECEQSGADDSDDQSVVVGRCRRRVRIGIGIGIGVGTSDCPRLRIRARRRKLAHH